MPRPSSLFWIAAAFSSTFVFEPRRALADSGEPHGTVASAKAPAAEAPPPSHSSLRGLDLLATVGWGASTASTLQLQLEPYGASFGFDAGYTWPSGFRLGAYFSDSLGHAVVQHREASTGPLDDFIADSSAVNGGLSVGWAVPVYVLVLRYTLSAGVTAMRWQIPNSITGKSVSIGNGSSPTVGVHFAPGLALLWPYRWFEAGIGYEYLAQANAAIPSGFVANLLMGVKL